MDLESTTEWYSTVYYKTYIHNTRALRVTLTNSSEFTNFQAFLLGGTPPVIPRFKRISGTIGYDVIHGDSIDYLLISENLVSILRNAKVTGWDVFDVEVENGGTGKYFGLKILGRCDPIQYYWEKKYENLYLNTPCFQDINISTWDGSDIFCPQESTLICMRENVVALLKSNGIKNIAFESYDKHRCKRQKELR